MELQSWPSPGQHTELQLHGRGVCARSNIHLWKVRRGCSLLPLISASVWILSAKPSGRKSSVIRSVHVCAHTHTVATQRKERHTAHNVGFKNLVLSEFYTRDIIQPTSVGDREKILSGVGMKPGPALSCPYVSGSKFVWLSLKLPFNQDWQFFICLL